MTRGIFEDIDAVDRELVSLTGVGLYDLGNKEKQVDVGLQLTETVPEDVVRINDALGAGERLLEPQTRRARRNNIYSTLAAMFVGEAVGCGVGYLLSAPAVAVEKAREIVHELPRIDPHFQLSDPEITNQAVDMLARAPVIGLCGAAGLALALVAVRYYNIGNRSLANAYEGVRALHAVTDKLARSRRAYG